MFRRPVKYTAPPGTIHTDAGHWDWIVLDRSGWPHVCMNALLIMYTDTGLWPGTCQIYDNHNINNAAILYLQLCIFYNFNILNTLILGTVLRRLMYWCLYSLYLRLPMDGALVPKHVWVFKTYVQCVIILCAFVCKCDWLLLEGKVNKMAHCALSTSGRPQLRTADVVPSP
jgi:hypothetical protein